MPRPLGLEYLHNLFGHPLYERFVSSPSFIYIFNHLSLSVWTHEYLFYTLGYNPVLLSHFVPQICPALPIGITFN